MSNCTEENCVNTAKGLWSVAAMVIELDLKGSAITQDVLKKTMKAGLDTSDAAGIDTTYNDTEEPLEKPVIHMPWIKERLEPFMIVDVVTDDTQLYYRKVDNKGRSLHSFSTLQRVCSEIKSSSRVCAMVARIERNENHCMMLLCFLRKGTFVLWKSDNEQEWKCSYDLHEIPTIVKEPGKGVGAIAQYKCVTV